VSIILFYFNFFGFPVSFLWSFLDLDINDERTPITSLQSDGSEPFVSMDSSAPKHIFLSSCIHLSEGFCSLDVHHISENMKVGFVVRSDIRRNFEYEGVAYLMNLSVYSLISVAFGRSRADQLLSFFFFYSIPRLGSPNCSL
jgi:hypothetical protein